MTIMVILKAKDSFSACISSLSRFNGKTRAANESYAREINVGKNGFQSIFMCVSSMKSVISEH